MRGTLRAFLLTGTALATGTVLTVSPAPAAAAAPHGLPKGVRKAIVLRIVDGDTIIARLTRNGPGVRIRFLGFDTPEAGRCWYAASTRYAARLMPVGKPVYLLRDRDARDHYGRRLFYAWNYKGLSVGRNLIRHGYAKALLYRSNDRYIRAMRIQQARARKDRLRIWSGRCDRPANTVEPNPSR
ncbi:thermonuclease family protein [Planobispora rosea]|uniref:thermonuclease family protein n=1 Tax=Planobispora rosea TaxID=35762 RepID=UPI00083B8B8F|nr:thermonuclease family protein [Planobispora rosea]